MPNPINLSPIKALGKASQAVKNYLKVFRGLEQPKPVNPLEYDPIDLGFNSKFWRESDLGQKLASTRLFRTPTLEEMTIPKLVEEAKAVQFQSQEIPTDITRRNVNGPTTFDLIDSRNRLHYAANPRTNTILYTLPAALPFWRKNTYKKLFQGAMKHEGAHLTQPLRQDLGEFDLQKNWAPNHFRQPITTYDKSRGYYRLTEEARRHPLLGQLDDRDRLAWMESPQEVLSELARLGQLGYLQKNGKPTAEGLRNLQASFELETPEQTQAIIDGLENYHGNFYTKGPKLNGFNKAQLWAIKNKRLLPPAMAGMVGGVGGVGLIKAAGHYSDQRESKKKPSKQSTNEPSKKGGGF